MKFIEFIYRCNNCGKETEFSSAVVDEDNPPAQPDQRPYCQACRRRGPEYGSATNVGLISHRTVEFGHEEYRKFKGYSWPEGTRQRPASEFTEEERAAIAARQAEREQQQKAVLDAAPSIADGVMRTRYGGTREQLREEARRTSAGGQGETFRAEQAKANKA